MSEGATLAAKHSTAEISFYDGLVNVYPMPSEIGDDWGAFALGTFSDGFPTREAALVWALEQTLEYLTTIPDWNQQP